MRRLVLFGLVALAGPAALAAPVPRDAPADAVATAVGQLADRLKKAPPQKPPGDGGLAVYLMDLAAGGVTLVASEGDPAWETAYLGSPSWSRDGSRIYFDASPGHGRWTETRVQSIGLTPGGLERTVLGIGNCPTPSPDGKDVAVLLNQAAPGDPRGIHVVPAVGGPPKPVGLYGIPRWSPVGRTLLVAQFANPTALEVVDADDGTRRPVVLAGHAFRSTPSWAGDRVLVAAVRTDDGDAIVLVDVGNPAEAAVTRTLWRRGDGLPEAVYPAAPAYSPTARRGVFIGREPGGGRLYAIEPGKPPRPLEPGRPPGKVSSPALSPDGRFLLFCDTKR